MSVSQNTENEQQNNLCTTLTEQWKKGELEDGFYYFRMPDGTTDIASEYKLIRYILVRDADKIEVLAPVPSYEEWKAAYECQLMESELVLTLKELLKECRPYVRQTTTYTIEQEGKRQHLDEKISEVLNG